MKVVAVILVIILVGCSVHFTKVKNKETTIIIKQDSISKKR